MRSYAASCVIDLVPNGDGGGNSPRRGMVEVDVFVRLQDAFLHPGIGNALKHSMSPRSMRNLVG